MYEPTFFDNIAVIKKPKISSNSIDSFHSEEVQEKRLTQKDKIFLACKELGLANDRMMSELSGVPLHLTPDRRGQLVTENKLTFSCRMLDSKTNMETNFYEVVE